MIKRARLTERVSHVMITRSISWHIDDPEIPRSIKTNVAACVAVTLTADYINNTDNDDKWDSRHHVRDIYTTLATSLCFDRWVH